MDWLNPSLHTTAIICPVDLEHLLRLSEIIMSTIFQSHCDKMMTKCISHSCRLDCSRLSQLRPPLNSKSKNLVICRVHVRENSIQLMLQTDCQPQPLHLQHQHQPRMILLVGKLPAMGASAAVRFASLAASP